MEHASVLADQGKLDEGAAELKAVSGKAPMLVSGVSGEGVSAVLRAALAQVRAARSAAAKAAIGTPQEPEDWKP